MSRTPVIAATAALMGAYAVHADFVELTSRAEAVDQSTWTDNVDARDLVTVSVYAKFDNAADSLVVVYGSSSNATALTISTSDSAGFFQYQSNPVGTYNTSLDINSAFFSLVPSHEYDSYLTIGLLDNTGNQLSEVGISNEDVDGSPVDRWDAFNDGSGQLTVNNGAIFITPDDTQGDAGNYSDNEVLIARLTVGEGETVSGTVNLQFRNSSDQTDYAYGQTFEFDASVVGVPWLSDVPTDFDGDGDEDILWQNDTTGALSCWFTDTTLPGDPFVSSSIYGSSISAWSIVGFGDFDGDGDTDILWQHNTTGALSAWYMDTTLPGDPFVSSVVYASNISAWSIVGILDLDGDGDEDILWQNNTTGALSGWFMDTTLPGDPFVSSTVYGSNISAWSIVGYGDMDGDGDDDILWQNNTTGALSCWYMDTTLPGDPFVSTSVYGSSISAWSLVGLTNLDGDLDTDVLWQNNATGALTAWYMDTTLPGDPFVSTGVYGSGISAWRIRQYADYDADGDGDILWQNNTTGSLSCWYMDTALPGNPFVSDTFYGSGISAWSIVNEDQD